MTDFDVVIGAFSYTGGHIAQALLDRGRCVRTLTRRPDRPSPFGDRVEGRPLDFADETALIASLRGASALYNTYWVRFERGAVTFDRAIENSRTLMMAAAKAGVRRFVHLSVTHASDQSPIPYYRAKAAAERALTESGLSYAIIRPTLLFGEGDVLINNIAWMLRRLPVYGVIKGSTCRMRPTYVGDVAALAVDQGQRDGNTTVDAVGPETLTLGQLVRLLRDTVHSHAIIVPMPGSLALAAAKVIGWLMRDTVMTRDEMAALTSGLLAADGPTTCPTSFTAWLAAHASELGTRYASDVRRHWRKPTGAT
jgi:NADH dehydrogenase